MCLFWYVSVKSVFVHEFVSVFMCACMFIWTIFLMWKYFCLKKFSFQIVLIENFLCVHVWMSVFVCWYVYVFVYVYIGVISVYLCVCGWKVFVIVLKCFCLLVNVCMYAYVCMRLNVCMCELLCVCMCVCVYMCLCMSVFVCIYVYRIFAFVYVCVRLFV